MRAAVRVIMPILTAVSLSAQSPSPTTAPMAFEAAAVKRNVDGGFVSGLRRLPGGRFEATNMPLAGLIGFAYALQPFELQGGPAWLTAERWDVIAKTPDDPPPAAPGTPDAIAIATRALLEERFKLVLRRATQEVDVYELAFARADGRPAPGLRQSGTDCVAVRKAADEAARGGAPASSPNTPDKVVCGIRNNGRRIQFGGYPMSMFTDVLTNVVQCRVVDRTGLVGNWEFDIAFTPTELGAAPVDAVPDPNTPSVFTALQEQLGLKLQSARVPLPVMIVDRVQRPMPD